MKESCDIQTYVELARQATSIEEIHSVCLQMTEEYGYDYFVYVLTLYSSFSKPQIYVISGYPPEWPRYYIEQDYMSHDPIARYCAQNVTPVVWSEVFDYMPRHNMGVRIMNESGDHGLKNGISIPVHGLRGDSGLLSLCRGYDSVSVYRDIIRSMPFVDLLARYIHEAAYRVFSRFGANSGEFPAPVTLNEQERECLLWSAEGKTSWEISMIMRIPERRVLYYIQNACSKLGVANKQHAVARAVSLGLLRLSDPIVINSSNLFDHH